ncbi:unnamed protein product, partial [Effrenium voratum]
PHRAGLKGRIFSGIGRVPVQEAPAKKRKGSEGAVIPLGQVHKAAAAGDCKGDRDGVPDTLVGRSAFAFKKLVRYIARHRLGSVKLDIKNSFFQLLNRQKPLPPIMAEYLDHREEKLAQIGRVLFHKLPEARRRSVAKELMIALGFGGGSQTGRARAAPLPRPCTPITKVADGEDGGGSRRAFNDHQHDGIGALRPVGIRGGKYPNLDWRLKSKMEFSEFQRAAARHTWTGEGKHRGLCEAGGGGLHVPVEGVRETTYESFEKGGFWLVRSRDDLGQTVEDLMCKMCCPVFETVDGNCVPPRLSTIMPSSPVCPRPFWGVWQPADLNSDETRHKILFCDGMLYDFKERVLRSPIPPTARLPRKATSEMWQPSKATKLFEHILAFLKEHVKTGVCLLEASENGKQ